eukprot:341847_1
MFDMTANHLLNIFLVFCILIFRTCNTYASNTEFYKNIEFLDELYNNYYNDYYYDEDYDDEQEQTDNTNINTDSIDNIATSSISDYTLYFNDYNFDWSKEEDWDKINIKNHNQQNNKPYQEIEACTFEITSIQKRVCVHSKENGGFKIKFKSIHNAETTAAKSLNSDNIYDNNEENTNNDISDFYDNIQLDWDNDADWSEISHTLSDYDSNTINTKYMNDMIQLTYQNNLINQYQDALNNYNQLYYQNYGIYPSTYTTSASNTNPVAAAQENILNNYYYDDYDDNDDDYHPDNYGAFTPQMQETMNDEG